MIFIKNYFKKSFLKHVLNNIQLACRIKTSHVRFKQLQLKNLKKKKHQEEIVSTDHVQIILQLSPKQYEIYMAFMLH